MPHWHIYSPADRLPFCHGWRGKYVLLLLDLWFSYTVGIWNPFSNTTKHLSVLLNFWLLYNGWSEANIAICSQGSCIQQDALALCYLWHGSGCAAQVRSIAPCCPCSSLPLQGKAPRQHLCCRSHTHQLSHLNLWATLGSKSNPIKYCYVWYTPCDIAPQCIITKVENTPNNHSSIHIRCSLLLTPSTSQ